MQSRASRINDSLTTAEVNEIADTAPGVTRAAVDRIDEQIEAETPKPVKEERVDIVQENVASIHRDGRVEIEKTGGPQ